MSAAAATKAARHSAQLPGGIALPYVECGPPDGAPLVLLHGAFDNWRSFLPVLPHLPAGVRGVAVTQRGHGGASQPPAAGYRVADLAADAVAFLDTMGIERAVLAGHSLGSAVALQTALDAADRVAGLVLAPGFARLPSSVAVRQMVASADALRDPIDRGSAEWLQEQARDEHLPPELFELMVEHTLRMPARSAQALIHGVAGFDVESRLREVTAPALLAWGEEDAFVDRATQDTLLRGLEDARLLVYRGGGHTPHWDDPRRFAAEAGGLALRAA